VGAATVKEHRGTPLRSLVLGVAVALSLIGAKALLEQTAFGRQLELLTYNLLQLRLTRSAPEAESPVVVVDISSILPTVIETPLRRELITPREDLLRVVRSVARDGPRAIGIDVDFSPSEGGPVTHSDTRFLKEILAMRNEGLPIFVGVFESVVQQPEQWLSEPEFSPLAAYLSIPRVQEVGSVPRMVEWVWPSGVSRPCPSLASALSQSELKALPGAVNWALNRVSIKQTEEFSSSEFAVDFSGLDGLMKRRISASSLTAPGGTDRAVKGKLVLIGRATPGETGDQFILPGVETPVPGVFVHACAAETLLARPLFTLTHAGRVVADVLAAAMVFGPVFLIELYLSRSRRDGGGFASHSMQTILTIAVVFVVIAVGHVLVRYVRLLWTDYLMVVAGLLLHGPCERLVGRLLTTAPAKGSDKRERSKRRARSRSRGSK
jgi:CHASE2 domain-containing sensor protein